MRINPGSQSPPNLLSLISSFTATFGYHPGNKSTRYRRSQIALTGLIWLDFIYSLSLISIASDQPRMLSLAGDIGYACFGARHRHIGTGCAAFYRLHLVVMQTLELFDHHQWLRKANFHFGQLSKNSFKLNNASLVQTLKNLKIWTVLVPGTLSLAATGCCIAWMLIAHRRGFQHLHYYTFFALGPEALFLEGILSMVFVFKYYLICKICIVLLEQYHHQVKQTLHNSTQIQPVLLQLREFDHLYLMIVSLNTYLRKSYLAIMSALFGISIFLFYGAFYSQLIWVIRCACAVVFFALLTLALRYSVITEQIDRQAKATANLVYRKVFIETKFWQRKPQQLAFDHIELFRYFETVLGNTVGLTILGNAINIQATITMFTFFFTVVAMFMKNFNF